MDSSVIAALISGVAVVIGALIAIIPSIKRWHSDKTADNLPVVSGSKDSAVNGGNELIQIDTPTILNLLHQRMADWENCFKKKDENRLFWNTNHAGSNIFIRIRVNPININVTIGIANENPNNNRFADVVKSLSNMSAPHFVQDGGWQLGAPIGERYYEKNIPKPFPPNNIGVAAMIDRLRNGLVQFEAFLQKGARIGLAPLP